MKTSDNFCFIPAKAASTRLKKKNILPIAGRALIYYGIEAAKKAGLFGDEIIVSSESEEIKTIAEKYGARVPYLRDEKLAKDPYGVADVLIDFLEKHPHYQQFKNGCIVLPTAPLVQDEDIRNAYEIFINGGHKSLMSVSETEHNAYRSIKVQKEILAPIFPEFIKKKSQELEKTFHINGAVIWVDIAAFLRYKTYFIEPVGAYIMPRERSIDIDTEMDYRFAKFIIEAYHH